MFQIGPYTLASRVMLAPMAGVTDLPFRRLCRSFGAALTTSEMITCDSSLWNSRKSTQRMNLQGEAEPRSVQIAGSDPQLMAQAARLNVEQGAQIIDINMGCPAKKVCKRAAGSALLKDEALVQQILERVVRAVDVPVTLKIRTGWAPAQRNGVTIANIAEDCGIAALAVHGRTRACRFEGDAEYDTIAAIKAAVTIPVIANGDIDTPEKARQVLDYTGVDAVMIGRAAQGRPWLFQQVIQFLATGEVPKEPEMATRRNILLGHLRALHDFYGEVMGVKIARKHVAWYLNSDIDLAGTAPDFRTAFNRLFTAEQQCQAIELLFGQPSPDAQILAEKLHFFTIGQAEANATGSGLTHNKEVIAA